MNRQQVQFQVPEGPGQAQEYVPDELDTLDDMIHFISMISDWSFATGDTSDLTNEEKEMAVFLAQQQALESGFESLREKKIQMIRQRKGNNIMEILIRHFYFCFCIYIYHTNASNSIFIIYVYYVDIKLK